MAAMIWDSVAGAFKEAKLPNIWDKQEKAWKNSTTGLVWNKSEQAWTKRWNPTVKQLIPTMESNLKPYGKADSYPYPDSAYTIYDGKDDTGVYDGYEYENIYLWTTYQFKSPVVLNKIVFVWYIVYGIGDRKDYTALLQYRRSESGDWITAGKATHNSDNAFHTDTVENINDLATSIRVYVETKKTYGTSPHLREVQAYGYYK